MLSEYEPWEKYKDRSPGYVYVIRFGSRLVNNWYIGATGDIKRRINEHLRYGYLIPGMQGELCGLIRFKTLQDAFIVEQAIHRLETDYDSLTLQCIVENSGGEWYEGEIDC